MHRAVAPRADRALGLKRDMNVGKMGSNTNTFPESDAITAVIWSATTALRDGVVPVTIGGDWRSAMSLQTQHDPKNEAEITYWNSAGGRHWVERQQSQDIVLGPILQATLERAQLRQGERVVDIGCGTGASSIALAERAGPSGQVLGIDVSAPMLARAAERKIFMPARAKKPVYAPYVEHVPPDVTAGIFWLKNRDPAHWRDGWQLEHVTRK
jgi:hypothetical protein